MPAPQTTETILIEFAKTVKAIAFYPEGHPNLEAIIEKTFNLIKEAMKEKDSIQLTIERSGFFERKTAIASGQKSVEALAMVLFLKKIREITFTKDATLEEWKGLLSILIMDADNLKKTGGLEKLLVEKNIKGIQLNEMKYEDIRKKVIEAEEAKKEKEAEIGEEAKAEQVEQEEVIHSLEDQLHAVKESEETLEFLLDKLNKEESATSYKTIAHKILEKIKPLREEKNWGGLFPVLIAFAVHSNPGGSRNPEQKIIASDVLQKLLHSDMTDYLITRLCSRHKEYRREIQQMLVLLGEKAMRQLLSTLINTEAAYARRQIFDTLTIFGEMVRLEAEKRLNDERWFVVRQMVSLLGEIGSPKSLESIKTAFSHKDTRVKSEALKAIAKIPSNESTAFLLQRLAEDNAALKLQAIISLGALRDPAAVESLGNMALKSGFFSESLKIRKGAVRSLGMIGGSNATTVLKNLLKKRVFWRRKENDEVRADAAISLGKIGGKDALETLEEIFQTSKGLVHIACKKAMEGLR